ncbi:MAG: UvrD-helicase domain-containing protein [Lachnospiraceae bacterium]|nr:UvrD-helicase domain-containing protein [Lachnospiraceae bacterium]
MNALLSSLNDMQQTAVLHDKGPLLILAGAGSGKTRVLTHRIAYLIAERDISPYQIIALTFTNKAAGEMKERVAGIVGAGAENIWVSTFHSSCVRILRRFIDTIDYDRNFTIYDSDDSKSLMKEVFKYLGIDPKKLKEKAVLGAISHAKDELIGPEEFAESIGFDPIEKQVAACYKEYQKRLKANNALDFDDLIFKTVELFDTNPDALDYYRRRFRYVLVDEYQDTNYAQFVLVSRLARYENEEGAIEQNLCVVGDDDQSIYRFRGADIRNILDFEDKYPDATVIRLEQNYRSTGNILDAANEVIHNNRGRKDKTLWTSKDKGAPVEVICYSNDNDEAAGVVGDIASRVSQEGRPYKDFAILYRTNAQSRAFEERLIYRNIPYRIIGGQNFYQRKEIKDILAYLKTIDGGLDSLSVKRIINVPKRGIGLATLDRVDGYAMEHGISFYEALVRAEYIPGIARAKDRITSFVSIIEILRQKLANGLSLTDLIDEILEATQYIDYLSDEDEPSKVDERIENINELISKLASYEEEAGGSGSEASLRDFLDEVSLVADIDSYSEDSDMVLLMTIHSAKGLEFPNVYLVGMEEGLFPSYMSINADNPEIEIEEERRLCYVGITRAEEHLTLSYCKQRMLRGEIQFCKVSRFVGELPRHLVSVSGDNRERRLNQTPAFGKTFPVAEKNGTLDFKPHDGKASRQETGGSSRYGGHSSYGGPYSSDTGSGKPSAEISDFLRANTYKEKHMMPPAGANARDEIGYGVGDQVMHAKFGIGTVTKIVKGGRDYEVTVDFEAGTKKMLASFAKMKKV